ncbi:MAG: sulfatase [Planctomycetota bacterium]
MLAIAIALLGVGLAFVGLYADQIGLAGGVGIGLEQWTLVFFGLSVSAAALGRHGARVAPARVPLLWAWIGLVGGYLEVLHMVIRRSVFGLMLHLPDQWPWHIPAVYFVGFGALGIGYALVGAVARPLAAAPVVVFVPTLLLAWGQTRAFQFLHTLAALALAVGVAASLARSVARQPEWPWALARRSVLWLLIPVVLAGVGWPIAKGWLERRDLDARPAAAPDAPNVLWIVLDTVRADHLSLHGYERATTPQLEELAKSSVVFDNAVAPCSWTLPTHSTLLTGRYHYELSCDFEDPLDATHPSLAEILGANGYATGAFIGNLIYCSAENGLARGFSRYEDFYFEPATIACSAGIARFVLRDLTGSPFFHTVRNNADRVSERFLQWEAERGDRPFFAMLNYFDAHVQYQPRPEWSEKFGDVIVGNVSDDRDRSESALRLSERAYDACIAFIDDEIGKMLRELDARGVLDDTLVMITADHGELFGEHGLIGHAHSLYWPLIDAPLLVRFGDRLPKGRRIDDFVTIRDMGATVLDLLGLEAQPRFPGHSLAWAWTEGGQPPEDPSPVLAEINEGINKPPDLPHSKGDMKSIVVDRLHYILGGDGSEELYDPVADPLEEHDLSAERPDALARARAALARALGQ